MLRRPVRLHLAACAFSAQPRTIHSLRHTRAAGSRPGSDELCAIVDEDNNVLRAEPRSVTVRDRLLGRGSYVVVCNSSDYLLVSKRSSSKDVYPGLQDTVISGVCLYGESYEDTALRELSEELGLPRTTLIPTQLRNKHVFRWTDESCDVWAAAYRIVLKDQVAADIKPQVEEVDAVQMLPLNQVQWMLKNKPERFTPIGAKVMNVLGLA